MIIILNDFNFINLATVHNFFERYNREEPLGHCDKTT